VGFVLEDDQGSLGGLVIAKRGRRAKLCALRVREPLSNRGWGRGLLRAAAEALCRGGTEEIYVTLSEALAAEHRRFFEILGFTRLACLRDKYVRGVGEFVYTWPREAIWTFLSRCKAGGLGPTTDARRGDSGALPDIIMSLRPRYARLILEGRKTIEFRRRFSRRHVGARVLFYVSSPVQAFQFTATIGAVHCSFPRELWVAHHCNGGVDEGTFDAYFAGASHGYALALQEVRPLSRALRLADALVRCPELMPPQSYKTLACSPGAACLVFGSLFQEEGDGSGHSQCRAGQGVEQGSRP
jgi:predicted transcriptional regulator